MAWVRVGAGWVGGVRGAREAEEEGAFLLRRGRGRVRLSACKLDLQVLLVVGVEGADDGHRRAECGGHGQDVALGVVDVVHREVARVEHALEVGEEVDGLAVEGRGDHAAEHVGVGREGGEGLDVEDERGARLDVADGVVVDGDVGRGASECLRDEAGGGIIGMRVCLKFAKGEFTPQGVRWARDSGIIGYGCVK